MIHPTAVVDPRAELGSRVVVGPFAVVQSPCRIFDDVWIGPHASVGTPAQMRGGAHPLLDDDPAVGQGVIIGPRTVVREFATVHQGVERTTTVGADCYLMAYAHVPHDALIEDDCTLSNAVQIGGHCSIGRGANLGLNALAHQRLVIGGFAMIGMGAVVTRHVPPFLTMVGAPARPIGLNVRGIERAGGNVDALKSVYDDRFALIESSVRGHQPAWVATAMASFRRMGGS